GRKLKRLVGTRELVGAAIEVAGIPPWLFDVSYEAVGDLAETIALLLPPPAHADDASPAVRVERDLLSLAGLPADAVRARLRTARDRLDSVGRFDWHTRARTIPQSSATSRNGKSNGSGTAFARSWFGAAARGCGRAAKSSSTTHFLTSSPLPARFRTASSSMARFSRGRTTTSG